MNTNKRHINKIQVQTHDYFNLISLFIIICLLLSYLIKTTRYDDMNRNHDENEYKNHFLIFFIVFLLYLMIDTISVIHLYN